jgi:dienelactone hydrolase
MNALTGIDYRHGDAALRGELALPSGAGPYPGVLVLHGGLGLTDDVRDYACKLASHGFAALAADSYAAGGKALPPETAGERMMALRADPAALRARTQAALAALAAHPAVDGGRLAAVGFCFGGLCALELARSGAELAATVSLHGLLTTELPAAPGAISGQVAVFTGARDPLVPPADVEALRDELTAAGAAWQITVFGEGWHGFSDNHPNPRYDWIRYDPLLDAQAWAATLALLRATLHPTTLPLAEQIAHEARAPAAIH